MQDPSIKHLCERVSQTPPTSVWRLSHQPCPTPRRIDREPVAEDRGPPAAAPARPTAPLDRSQFATPTRAHPDGGSIRAIGKNTIPLHRVDIEDWRGLGHP